MPYISYIESMMRKKKKLPEGLYQATIHALSHEGRGIAHINGKTTFIDNALIGEEVDFEYTYSKSQYDEGKAIHIKTASADRVVPACPHFSMCGGCSMQHLSQEAQILHKEQTLLNHLKHFGNLSPTEVLAPITGPAYGYRTKARLGVRFVIKKGSVLVGFREKYSNFLAQIDSCAILAPEIGQKITALRELIVKLNAKSEIAQIEVAVSHKTTALIFRNVAPLIHSDEDLLRSFAKEHHFTIYLQPKGPDSIHLLSGLEDGWLSYFLENQKLELLFHPTDFTQINLAINQQMVDRALSLLNLQAHETVLDLFCGLGNFTLPLAQRAKQVTGVEGSLEMTKRAQMNADHNHITNTSFYAHDLTKDISTAPWAATSYDAILIDPPRSGAKELIEQIRPFKAKRIVYVSCHPATLARDAEILKTQGYTLQKAGVLDMFPHTSHVESIALFQLNGE